MTSDTLSRSRRALLLTGLGAALLLPIGCKGQNATTVREREAQTAAPPQGTAPAPSPEQPAQSTTTPPSSQPREVGTLPSLAPLVQSVKGAVVNVEVRQRAAGSSRAHGGLGGNPFDPFFGMPNPHEAPQQRQGAGSGFIIDPRGRVLTNAHVVQDASTIQIKLDDGRQFAAKVLGSDPLTDLALLQLEGGDLGQLPTVKLGNSDELQVGDYVVAIGNPFGLASSVSAGILSARARDINAGPYDDFLQTDAAINPGNSGGPLFNLRGEVMGINTAIVGGGTGIGFAVPSNIASALLPQLEGGEVRRGWLGVGVQDLTAELGRALGVDAKEGAVVSDVTAGTPAARGGLKPDDIIVSVNGEAVDSARTLTRTVGFMQPGREVTLQVLRGGDKRELKVTLGERPDLERVRRPQAPEPEEEARTSGLGLTLRDGGMRGTPPGALILQVEPGSVAESAGLAPGMTIVEAGGEPVKSARELTRIVQRAKSGSTLLLRVQVGQGRVLRALPIP